MKSTSRSSRLVSCAARSPALAITGPEVERKLTPSSRATICASVVLPRPGGPTKSTWSRASPRDFAASMKTWRLARAAFWPVKSSSDSGRIDASASSSRFSGLIRRRESVKEAYLPGASYKREPNTPSLTRSKQERAHGATMNSCCRSRRAKRGKGIQSDSVCPWLPFPALRAAGDDRGLSRKLPQTQPDQRLRLGLLAGLLDRGGNGRRGLDLGVAEIDQGRDGVSHGRRRAPVLDRAGEADEGRVDGGEGRGLVLEFRDDALGELRPDAGAAGDGGLVAGGDGGSRGCRDRARRGCRAPPWSPRPGPTGAAGTTRAPNPTGSRTGGSCPRAHGSRWTKPPPRRWAAGSGGCGRSNGPHSRPHARRGSRNPRRRNRPRL